MKIDRHISELLFDHDCVIVPSFGGFLGSYQSAQHNGLQHTFYPPSKKIAFNVFLKNNDGLLAHHVAEQEKLTYSEALKGIEDFRLDITKALESGKRIVIEDVGTLFYDKQKNLQFEASKSINYLEEAFGLTGIQSPPVKREEQRKKIERQIRQAVTLRSSVKPPQVKTGRLKSAWKVFNTVVLSGALLWFAFNIYLITPHHGNVSSLNPFSYSSSEKVESKSSAINSAHIKTTASIPAQTQKTADSIDNLLPDKEPVTTAAVTLPPPPVANKEASPTHTTTISSEKNFYLIAGVFHEAGNAEKLVTSLKQDGFADAAIINPQASVKKVCYSHFSTRKEATVALEQIHAVKKDGWVLQQ